MESELSDEFLNEIDKYMDSLNIKKNQVYYSIRNEKIKNILAYFNPEHDLYDQAMVDEYNNGKVTLTELLNDKFKHKTWDEYKSYEQKRLNTNTKTESNTIDICHACKKQNVYMIEKQTRSGDEATTKFYKCLSCNKAWKKN